MRQCLPYCMSFYKIIAFANAGEMQRPPLNLRAPATIYAQAPVKGAVLRDGRGLCGQNDPPTNAGSLQQEQGE